MASPQATQSPSSVTLCRTSSDRIPSRSSSPAPALAGSSTTGARRAAFAASVVDPAGSHHPTSHHSSKHGLGSHAPHQRGHHGSGAGSRGSSGSGSSGSAGGMSHNSAAVKWEGPMSVRLASAAAACCTQLVQQGELCEALSRRLAASRLAVLVVRVVKEAEGAGKGGSWHCGWIQEITAGISTCCLWAKASDKWWPASAAAAAAASCMYALPAAALALTSCCCCPALMSDQARRGQRQAARRRRQARRRCPPSRSSCWCTPPPASSSWRRPAAATLPAWCWQAPPPRWWPCWNARGFP
jgi:hypothetical protein